ncbi:GMC family oxidoreductase [Flavobacterium circumlabens]|uniref:Choline dehydrogenase-like flavoprotein n=1 Tax=Flavobacterium circumlabens TaxID=2133765 RepID=A0A4Y7UG21_9FLAO|nr:GMC family oxidoreductase [Flavobacterium circumlabens]TCN59560.1 choline dehydrogenase-like flavoprotein [Flavobacterium circumlabens]TEB44848.1 GMC family oxidoreductase [Flavobacterium circumlabens]
MVNINSGGVESNSYDAIVIGSGITGGWAAKELCEQGLKTLVIERGRMVEHIKDYPTALLNPWEFENRNNLTLKQKQENPILSRCYAYEEATDHFFVKDDYHPYIQKRPFNWIKGYQVGGKSLMWARWTQRWGVTDFEANAKEGIAVDWPIRYDDLAPWYSYVERFAGISGNRDGLAQIPDGEFLPPMDMNCIETHLQKSLKSNYNNRHLVISRTANLSQALSGRGPCQYRNLCFRGCPFGGYFSSNSTTIPAAEKTGNLSMLTNAVVHSIIYDEDKQKAKGVRVINALTNEVTEYFAKIVFVNAGTLNSTLILMNSTSSRFPNGMGNDSGELGHNLMDHNYNGRISGEYHGYEDQYYAGRKPTGSYLARFRNFGNDKQKDFLRGYAFACNGSREIKDDKGVSFGADLKNTLTEPGVWKMGLVSMGECLPSHENKISLSKDKKDRWGIPLLEIDASFGENEKNMMKDILKSGAEMLDKAGFINIEAFDTNDAMGLGIHEMGTARMGHSSKTSVLNKHNQVWGAENVFVTDGSCMTSGSCQNPSLTYMAITARAAHYAVEELKKNNL